MCEITTYKYLSYEIRTILNGDQSFFVAQDIGEALGLSNTSLMCRKLPDDEKILRQLLVAGQQRYMICITISGLLSVISKANSPNAKVFLHWISRYVPFAKNLETHALAEIGESQTATNSCQAALGGYDIHFSLDLSLPPDAKSLAVLERITGIDLRGCLTNQKEVSS